MDDDFLRFRLKTGDASVQQNLTASLDNDCSQPLRHLAIIQNPRLRDMNRLDPGSVRL